MAVQVWIKYTKSTIISIMMNKLNPLPHCAFANRADPDQAALVRAADQGLLCLLLKYDISNPTQLGLNMKVYLYNYT